MRIIEPGQLPEEKLYNVRCHKCHALIEFVAREGKYVLDQRDGDFMQFQCPTCKNTITAGVLR